MSKSKSKPQLAKPRASKFRAGFVALIGRPNVGKSTLLNNLLGEKIAPTTHKPQTSRFNIHGILNVKNAQIALVDTPGLHSAKGPLNKRMVQEAESAMMDVDLIVWIIEAQKDASLTPGNQNILKRIIELNKPVILVINKIDQVKDKSSLLVQMEIYQKALGESLKGIVPISALKKKGFEQLEQEMVKNVPPCEQLFDPEQLTDRTEREIVQELIREKIILETKEELPYSTTVVIEQFEDGRPERRVKIFASIHVERENQKPIVIGHRGERIKTIGTRARKELERFLSAKVYLDLHVVVTPDWSNSLPRMEELEVFGARR